MFKLLITICLSLVSFLEFTEIILSSEKSLNSIDYTNYTVNKRSEQENQLLEMREELKEKKEKPPLLYDLTEIQKEALQAYPNPSTGPVQFSRSTSFKLYNTQGQFVADYKDVQSVDVSTFADGYYILRSTDGGSLRILKK